MLTSIMSSLVQQVRSSKRLILKSYVANPRVDYATLCHAKVTI
jgi:hypothetical protein